MPENLNYLRRQIKEKMRGLTADFCSIASKEIIAEIVASDVFTYSTNIACYIPIDNEVDVRSIIEIIWEQGKNCYLPALDSNSKFNLQFIKFQKDDELIITKYGISEPKSCSENTIAAQDLDLVIVPMLGFNNRLFRLGRGAGCYDRTFEFKKKDSQIKPCLFGVSYEWQYVEFEPRTWDVAMNMIAFGGLKRT